MASSTLLRFMIAILLPLMARCPEEEEINVQVEEDRSALMMIRSFTQFNESETFSLAKVAPVVIDGTNHTLSSEVLTWTPGQSLQNASIAESYKDRVSLKKGPDGIAVHLREVKLSDAYPHAYYQFQQEGVKGPKIKLHILEPPYNLAVTRKDTHGHVHLQWTAGFKGGLDTTYTVQYRKVGGDWVDAPEPPSSNHPQYTDIVHLPGKGNYGIRIRAANRIGSALSNVTNVTIEDATTLYGVLPITNWNYSDDLQTQSTAVISELDKVFNSTIGYDKSEIGETFTSAGDMMVEFRTTIAKSEITSAQSAFLNSILRHERLGEFNIDKDKARINDVKPKGVGLSDLALWLYRGHHGFWIFFTGLQIAVLVVALLQMFCPDQMWAKSSPYLGPVISALCICIILIVIYAKFGHNGVLGLGLFYAAVVAVSFLVMTRKLRCLNKVIAACRQLLPRRFNQVLPIMGIWLVLYYTSVIIQLGYNNTSDHTERSWLPTTTIFIFTASVLAGFVTVLLWCHFLSTQEQAQENGPPNADPPKEEPPNEVVLEAVE